MKKISLLMTGAIAGCMVLSSCMKNFDPATYRPPLSVNGYTSTKGVATANLVAYYSFNGSLIDSVSKTEGTNTGTTFTKGVVGQAMQGALNSYVTAQPSADVKNLHSFTVTEWINTPPPTTGILGLFTLANTTAFWGNIEAFIENGSTPENGKVRIHIAQGGNDLTFAVDNVLNLFNKAAAIAFSYDETTSTCKLYVNGSVVKSGKVDKLSGPLSFTNVGPLVFGCVQFMTVPSSTSATDSQPWASYLTGTLDEVRIYNKALSDTEVSTIVNLQNRGK